MKTKIDIISGFLGAGKTTLIKKLLREKLSGEKLIIIENEFGEIGIDGSLLKNSEIKIEEINSGCICCTLVGNLEKTILNVIEKYKPERIIIEPSGVGKLSEVIKACETHKLSELVQINMLITVVDVSKCEVYLSNFGEFFENQIINARNILLSRTHKVSQEKLEAVINSIRKLNFNSNIVSTPWESIKAEQIIAVAEQAASISFEKQMRKIIDRNEPEGKCSCGHHHKKEHHICTCDGNHNHNADEVFAVWSIETSKIFTEKQLRLILSKLDDSNTYGTVLRGKGILQTEEQWIQFDLVPGEVQLTSCGADYSGRLCIIGKSLDKLALNNLFNL